MTFTFTFPLQEQHAFAGPSTRKVGSIKIASAHPPAGQATKVSRETFGFFETSHGFTTYRNPVASRLACCPASLSPSRPTRQVHFLTDSLIAPYPDLYTADVITKFNDLEWEQRDRLFHPPQDTPEDSSQWARLTGNHVAVRNRYINVEPFANNRVKLQVPPAANDYINASPIALDNRRYIATQGPKDTSTSHFYRMLAAELQSPAVVVMLTQTHEAGREKCFQYFPDSPEQPLQLVPDPEDHDGFGGQVDLLSTYEDSKCRCTIRHLRLYTKFDTKEGEEDQWQEKEIYHLLFSGWPDFSIPEGENRQAMLDLIALSADLNRSPTAPSTSSFPTTTTSSTPSSETQAPPSLNPRIVHCSAGVGRSGTFIALDYLLAQLASGHLDAVSETSDPIASVVDKMRRQRMMMVQSEQQFCFLYDVMRQAWISRYNGSSQAGSGAESVEVGP